MSSSDRGRGDAPGARHEPSIGQPKLGQPAIGQPAMGQPAMGQPAMPVPTGTPASAADAADPYPNWLDRMQRARARHAAITKNLYSWSNYKNWADKMRDSWEDDESAAKGVPAPGMKPPLPRK